MSTTRTRPLLTLAAIGVFGLTGSAPAATFKPTRFEDPPPGKCKPKDCSLREAVIAANQHVGEDVVKLARGTYRLEIPQGGGPDAPEIGDLDVTGPGTVKGKGPKATTVKGSGSGRVFELDPGGRTLRPDYALSRMTVRGGLAPADDGGAILVGFSETRLSRLVVAKSQAQGGGGIAAAEAHLRISRTTVRDNVSQSGGGFFAPAAFNDTEVTIGSSTISGNRAGGGGGIALDGLNSPGAEDEPVLDLVNSTVAGNHANNGGGGLVALNGATINLDNTTVAYNDASLEGQFGSGGGIEQLGSSVVGIEDSIVAANTVGSGGSGPQCFGTLQTSVGGNLFQGPPPDSACSYSGINAADALIGPPAKNGGPTHTVKLLTASPAIALAQTCPAKDQRGKPRPEVDCDSGAFERMGP